MLNLCVLNNRLINYEKTYVTKYIPVCYIVD